MFNFESNLNVKNVEGSSNFSKNKLDSRINELSVSENFVESFFYEVVKAKKEAGSMKKMRLELPVTKKFFSHPDFPNPEKQLIKEAQKISILEEMPIPVPRPVLLHQTQQKTKPTIMQIALPPPPRYISRESIQNNTKNSAFKNSKNAGSFIDLGQLNILINDPETTLMQCDGLNQPLRINKAGKLILTDMALDEREIMDIINKFSLRSQSPITEPIFRASTEHLAITAIISSLGSKFVITKR
ncbi:MAG: hypothetical protein NTX24_01930 [Candidatus Pacearchaeota archaeon]|nr:hypothetical protein [Candidatus Pacearchaeota archaeon]